MATRTWCATCLVGAVVLAAAYVVAADQVASAAAGALLHPLRRGIDQVRPAGCADATFAGAGVALRGWRCQGSGEKRGALVFLHGVADNRGGMGGLAARFTGRGLDVVAYDSRAHGESGGDACTYGYWEKADLRKVLDSVPGPVVLLGASLGAAVALQEVADDNRVVGVVAAEVFSDLRTVARERAPWFLTEGIIRRAFAIAEERGRFPVDSVSPVDAARRIQVPVLLIHGAQDVDTPADHSRRVLAALAGPKELLLVEGAGHNQSLGGDRVWQRIDRWIDDVLTAATSRRANTALHPTAAAPDGERPETGRDRR
jgi:uncharacterized protein